MAKLFLHDSAARTKRHFEPLNPQHVRLYVCGPTVYDLAHLGNARPVVVFDVLARLLRRLYPHVTYARNITDVDDKINARARESGEPIAAITARTTADFHADMEALGALPPDVEPRATGHIAEMITLIERLIANGHAYAADGHVLFSVPSFANYGKLSGRSPDELLAGARVDVAPYKRDAGDFVLWKPSYADTPGWESPWGRGRPGWHIECSAMSIELLDGHVDLHVGGIDLRFPHHENERAQSNSLTGDETVDSWVHGEHLLFEGRKMSKSAGNVVLLQDIIDRGLDPLSLRFALLENRYRSQMDLSWASLEAAHSTLKRWRQLLSDAGSGTELKFDQELSDALTNDLDTPRAMQRIRAIEKDSSIGALDKRAIFLFADQVLGLDLDRGVESKEVSADIQALLDARITARAEKNWALSDSLRDQLSDAGLEIKDGADGQSWSWK